MEINWLEVRRRIENIGDAVALAEAHGLLASCEARGIEDLLLALEVELGLEPKEQEEKDALAVG